MENRSILVIEDNELNMKLMRGIFQLGNYRIIEAVDAETGMRLAREHRPFLILMDIQLPGMDGLKATRIIKSDSELKDIPVVALTGFAMQGDEKKRGKRVATAISPNRSISRMCSKKIDRNIYHEKIKV